MALSSLAYLSGALLLLAAFGPDFEHAEEWNVHVSAARPETNAQDAADRALIESQPVCVGSRVWSAGDMGDTVYYRYRREGDRLVVGYFVHWSTERPWGNNVLTYAVLPAFLVDAVYSHGLFVLPGVRHALYGPGDIEGVSVTYDTARPGKLVPIGAHADDGTHDPIVLDQADLDADGRTALVTEVWSHQLGGRAAADYLTSAESAGSMRCFEGGAVRPLTSEIAETFHLGAEAKPKRAKPAWRLESANPAG